MRGGPSASGAIGRLLVALAGFAALAGCPRAGLARSAGNFSTLTTTGPNTLGGTTTLNGDALACSGRPWLDVSCYGAKGDDTTDDTGAFNSAIAAAVTNGWPLHIPAGTYKVTAPITIDYAGRASAGFRLISEGATIDGRSIASGPVLKVECSGGTPASPATCFYFHEQGTLFVDGDSNAVSLASLASSYSAGATTLAVSTTAGFYFGGAIDILLADGSTYATSVSAIGAGTITIAAPGLPSSANSGAAVSRPSYVFQLGKVDFSDQHNALKIDHLSVNNAASGPGAGACQFNAVYDGAINAICDSAGGAAGIALEQVQFSRISGAGSAAAAGGTAMLFENGYNFSNTIFAFDFENAPTCLGITFTHDGDNTFVSPYFDCTTAVNATASTGNVLINPDYAGSVVNRGPQSTGIRVIGNGSWAAWQFPTVASFKASGVDGGTVISSYNTTGASLAVSLPSPSAVGAGWWIGLATDNDKGLSVSPTSGAILANGKSVPSMTLAGVNYQYVELQSDGSDYRVVVATRATRLANGFEAPPWPSNWLYPATAGYAATVADNGNVLSSYNTASGLTVTLPPTAGLPNGWSMGFATDSSKSLTVDTNATGGGNILYPGSSNARTTATMAGNDYEFMALQFDGGRNFRVIDATPATAQALGMLGSTSGVSRWRFPATSAYAAVAADGGSGISAYNSPTTYMTVTLPPVTAVNAGWMIGLASDNNKTMSVQVNGTSGGHILYPGSGATATSLSLAADNYEYLVLQSDGSNFRVVAATPATATKIGMVGSAVGLNRWSFPSVDTYAAGPADNGNVISSYNSAAGLTVTLPQTTALTAGWQMGFAADNSKSLSVQVNSVSGGAILYPDGASGKSATSLALASGDYEFVALQFDGSNFRVVSVTPRTAAALGMLGHQIFTGAVPSVAAGSADCGTAPSIAGNDSLGRITVGSGTNGGKCTITFAQSWPSPPVCFASDESNAALIRPVGATTTGVAFAGTLIAGDSLVYRCAGYQ